MNGLGLNLTGGGARGAYQSGALLALAQIAEKNKLLNKDKFLFDQLSGVSAGAINIACVAGAADNFLFGMNRLETVWSNLQPNKVYRTDWLSLGTNIAKWTRDLSLGTLSKEKRAKFLLDTAPLRKLLENEIPFDRLKSNFDKKMFSGIACSAYNYYNQRLITFLKCHGQVSWDKPKRYSVNSDIDCDRVLASCSIPLLFPAVKVGGHYMGDGSFRSSTPISPLIHMGAKKILVIGVRGPNEYASSHNEKEPGVSRIAGLILNALFFDTIDVDVERIEHINEIMTAQVEEGSSIRTKRSSYTKIDLKIIRPTQDISQIASRSAQKSMPRGIEFLLGGLGSQNETNELASYILFDSHFTKQLIDLGYEDTMGRSDEIVSWLIAD